MQVEDIIEAFSNKSLILNQTISHDKFRQYLIKRDIVSAQIEQDILNGIRTGHGALIIKNDSHYACLIISEKEKAHEAMIALVEESGVYHSSWVAHSSLEGEIKSKIHNLEELMENSSKAEQYWKLILDQGMGDLSRAAQEISNGGLSSYSKRRIKKQKAESAKSKQVGGEEE